MLPRNWGLKSNQRVAHLARGALLLFEHVMVAHYAADWGGLLGVKDAEDVKVLLLEIDPLPFQVFVYKFFLFLNGL